MEAANRCLNVRFCRNGHPRIPEGTLCVRFCRIGHSRGHKTSAAGTEGNTAHDHQRQGRGRRHADHRGRTSGAARSARRPRGRGAQRRDRAARSVRRRSSRAPTRWKSSRSCRAAEHSSETNHTSGNENTRTTMTFEPSASQAQIDARQHAFDNQPDPATLVSREEIRAPARPSHGRHAGQARRGARGHLRLRRLAPPSRWR